MVFYIVGCWCFGLVWIAVLSEFSRAESLRVVALARGVFVAGTALMLTVTAVIVASANSNPDATLHPTSKGLWGYSLGCAIPVTVLALLAARRAFARRAALALAMLPAIALLVLEADAFRADGAHLNGLAEVAHAQHLLVVMALIVPVAALGVVAALQGEKKAPAEQGLR